MRDDRRHSRHSGALLGPVSALLLASCLCAAPAGAEIYTWTDVQGRVHMTDDPGQVPLEQRAQSQREATEPRGTGRWNSLPASAAGIHQSPTPRRDSGRPGRYVLRVDRAGSEMRVFASLNGGRGIPFIVDTGAMLNTIPREAVQELGIRIGEDSPVTAVTGIGGKTMLVPVVTIRTVDLGGAIVENVEMAVLDTMSSGLLGMPFFNNFKVQTDPSRGTLTIEELDLNAIEGIYGGHDEKTWRRKFGWVRYQRNRLKTYRHELPDEYITVHERLERSEIYWEQQLELLEMKASRAGVPRAWRE